MTVLTNSEISVKHLRALGIPTDITCPDQFAKLRARSRDGERKLIINKIHTSLVLVTVRIRREKEARLPGI
jgi:hypothetical protein